MTETIEVPGLELDERQRQQWERLSRALAEAARERRYQAARSAWSRAKAAERDHEQLERHADPAMRAMTVHEREAWAQRHQRPDRDPTVAYTRRAHLPTGSISVTVEPCGQRWGLEARGTTADGRVVEALVSCADRAIATQLANDVAEKGADAVGRLQAYAIRAAERGVAARSQLRETEEQCLTRTAATVHALWSGPLAEAVTGAPAPGYNLTTSPAFGALAWHLREREERGYAMVDVLRSLDAQRLRSPTVKNPAALATSFVKKQQEKLSPINLDGPDPGRGAARGGTPGPDDQEIEAASAVDEILAGALASEDLRPLQSHDDVRQTLRALYTEGLRVETLLRDLPVEKVLAKDNPGRYLAAILERRAEHLRPSPTGVDQAAMAAVVRRSLEQPVADKVINCRAWPGLAERLQDWQQQGMPVGMMLESLPVWDIDRHRHPATYTRELVNESLDRYLTHLRFSKAAAEEIAPSRDDRADPAPSRADTHVGEDRTRDDLDDPDIEALVENAIAQARQHDSTAAETRAPTHDLDATRHRATPDHPDTARREDHVGNNSARVDERAEAGERASAAEQRGARTAAATRAEMTYTPPDSAHDTSVPTTRPAGSPARPVPSRVPIRDRSPERRR
jgi:hypothetical protein